MKRFLLSLVAIAALALSSFGQAPEGFKYQAVVRDAGNLILSSQAVGMQLTIQQGSIGGTAVYTETFAPTTNAYGLVNLEIGSGTSTDDFSTIDWANGPYFMETAVDVTGGTSYSVMGTSQLMSVPYALYANTSGSGVGPAGADGNDGATGATGIDGPAGADGIGIAQTLLISGDTLFISSGNYILIPGLSLINSLIVEGCTDPTAFNYDASANTDDGSCIAVVNGCMDPTACNYNSAANVDDASCNYAFANADCSGACLTGYTADVIGACVAIVNGCTDPTAFNYDASANTDDGSCSAVVNGCMDPTAFNYDASANTDDGSCSAVVNGCTDPTAFNYDASANADDGSCIAAVHGCTDPTALNYDASANTDDGSCTDPLAIGDTYQGGIVFYLDGNGGGLIAAPTDQSTGAEWGCFGTSISGADGTAIGTGAQNTIDIEAGCTTVGTAADICANLTLGGYSDWFLPSKDELNAMYLNIGQGNTLGLGNVGGFFGNIYYRSSSETSAHGAWVQFFDGGYQISNSGKAYNFRVRAVRIMNLYGCTDPTAFNYDASVFIDDGSCIAVVNGCTNSLAINYDASANTDDGSCLVNGCTDPTACNYNSAANVDDASCSYAVSNADCSGACLTGYTTDGTGACVAVVNGCTDPTAFNYDASANTDDGSCIAVVTQFDFTGSAQTFTVPAGVTSILVDAYGASGTTFSTTTYGGNAYWGLGKGGRVQTNLTVTPGDVLNIYVGGTTLNYSGWQSTMGGWNGGGNGGDYGGFAGGGATDIRIGGTSLSDRVIVSGGGGGRKEIPTSSVINEGHGGGLVGERGAYGFFDPNEVAGQGGTQSNGGQGGCRIGNCAAAGTLGSGGNGVSIAIFSGGGGGGGYYGGGGGADGGGGGGSSYTDPTLCSSVVHTQGARTGLGQLTITIP